MGLITETVWVTVNSRNKKYYQELGYVIPEIKDQWGNISTPRGTNIKVNTTDLSSGSHSKVDIICDQCKKIYTTSYQTYEKYQKDGIYICNKCSKKIHGYEKSRKTRLKNGISFMQWCLNNNRTDILDRWDYELNACSPNEISYCSNGSLKQGYWFKCAVNPLHKSELKKLSNFTSRGGDVAVKCNQCNSVAQFIINQYGKDGLKKYWSLDNTNDPWNISTGSRQQIKLICPDCMREFSTNPLYIRHNNISCQFCSDGISYPEKFVYTLLMQIRNKNTIKKIYTQKTFNWSVYNNSNNPKLNGIKRYDFYIKEYGGIIIETHGGQHYGKPISKNEQCRNSSEEKENDIIKEQIAKKHIEHYIPLDCSESSLEHIKKSIMLSDLPKILHITDQNVDWLMCHQNALRSYVKKVCDMWNDTTKNLYEISNYFNLHESTIRRYLKQGKMCGLCNYDSKKSYSAIYVICLNNKTIYESLTSASLTMGIDNNNNKVSISRCCRGKVKSAGKLSDGTPLRWMYLDEYMQQNGYTDKMQIPGVTIHNEETPIT